MTSIKKDKLKVFSILAGIVFLILAVGEAVRVVINLCVPEIIARITDVEYTFTLNITTILSFISPVLFITLAIASAILLFTKKNSVASLIPVGLLTYVAFKQPFSFIFNLISSLISSLFGMGPDVQTTINMIATYVPFVCGLVCAMIFTALICTAGCTFLKKRRFILMIVAAAIFVLGSLFEIVASLFYVIICMISILSVNFPAYAIFIIAWNNMVHPIIIAVHHLGLIVATAFATVGMISKPAKVTVEIEDATEAVEPETEEIAEIVEAFDEE